ncbi:fimbrial assembly protein [Salmonella enterica]|nr:fimbrial assembly protein [Salmonella enterica]
MENIVVKNLCRYSSVLLLASAVLFSQYSLAAVNVDRTRIVMSSSDKSLAITLTNENKTLPYLAQSWVEDKDGKRQETYLLALPPLQRIDGGKKAQVRIMALPGTATLPQDRETLFYYNVREVPPKSDQKNVLQIAMQSRLKLFWRPESIKKDSRQHPEQKLTITRGEGQVTLNNPTPYYITLGYLGTGNKGSFPGFESAMVAPFSSEKVTTGSFGGDTLSVGYIDDFGGLQINEYHCAGALCTLYKQG